MMNRNNVAGRAWLQGQIDIAAPALTQAQLTQIDAALKLPSFPAALAKLVSDTAAAVTARHAEFRAGQLTFGQSAEDTCARGRWDDCAISVKRELESVPPPERAVRLALLWGKAFDGRYDALRREGRLERATSNADKIYEAVESKVESKVNPADIAVERLEKAVKDLLIKYLPRLAPLLAWADKPLAAALKSLFDPTEIATDFDELLLVNRAVQEQVNDALRPYMKSDWKDTLRKSIDTPLPQLIAPTVLP
jgi:hypothetical protein